MTRSRRQSLDPAAGWSRLEQHGVKGYELRERIGAGGFGAVYRAYQSTVGREVAVKVILAGFSSHPDFIRRFEVEARLVARLEHLHIVPLYDYWRDPEGAFLVMRYLRGGNLYEALLRGTFDLDSAALLLDQISSALSLAHSNRIVHGDIKPANILFDEDGNAYLADFGIARDVQPTGEDVPHADLFEPLGDYLAPEQARHEPVTPQTDVYSLGIVLYEMLTGEHPFPNLTPVERLFKHLNDSVPSVGGLDPQVAVSVNRIIQEATAKDPGKRFASAVGLATAFREAIGLGAGPVRRSEVELLTSREQEVLRLLLDGRSNRDIAEALVIEVTTVKWYVHQIFRKLNVRTRMQAIVRARELDLVLRGGVRRVEAEPEAAGASPPPNPYRGLKAFQVADERTFFGRERLVQRLLARLAEDDDYGRVLVIVGPSGSGKSSLVQAGLIPALWRGGVPGSERWFVVEMTPGERPLDQLEIALMRVASRPSVNLMDLLQRDAHGLTRAAQLILPDDGSELLVVIDQFEELFTQAREEADRLHFLALLCAAATEARSRVRLLIALRADYYDRPLQHPNFGTLVQARTEAVLPLTVEELERAIQKPATAVGVKFEDGLVASIIHEVHYQPGALPLMQYALTELFEHRDDLTLTRAAYDEIGGSVGALARRMEGLYGELSEEGRYFARQMFLRLVTPGEASEDTRRKAHRSELLALVGDRDLAEEVIEAYAANRLLTLDHDPASRSPTVELAHEAILRAWDRLSGWLEECRSDIRRQRLLAAATREWESGGRDPSYLLRGVRLAEFERWSAESLLVLTANEAEYLRISLDERAREASVEAARREREMDLERRRRRLSRSLNIALSAGLMAAVGLSLVALGQRQSALAQAGILLAAQAESEAAAGSYDRAVLLALAAVEDYPYSPQAEHALAQAVTYDRALQQFLGHSGAVTAVDWSPDGSKIASSSTDNTVRVWDAVTGAQVNLIPLPAGITGNVFDWGLTVKWSPDGTRLLTVSGDRFLLGSQDYDLILWDAGTSQQLKTVEIANRADPEQGRGTNTSFEHYAASTLAAFSPSGDRLATAGGDDTALIWDASLERQMEVLRGHENDVNSVAWSPDGSRLVTGSEDGTARTWNSADGEALVVLTGHAGGVTQVAFAPDGRRLASASKDGTLRIWDAETGDSQQVISPNGGPVWSLAWSRDGSHLVLGTDDGLVRLWEVGTGEQRAVLNGEQTSVFAVAWAPNHDWLASGGSSGSVRLWDTAPDTSVLALPYGFVQEISWSPDGRTFALAAGSPSVAGNLALWDLATGAPVNGTLNREFDPTWRFQEINYSPDGRLVLARGSPPWPDIMPGAATVHILDPGTGREMKAFTADDGGFLRDSSWSPDGSKIAGGTWLGRGTLYIWDFRSGEILATAACGDSISTVDWSPDGAEIALLCGSVQGLDYRFWIEVRDATRGDLRLTLTDPDPTALTNSVSWSPDGLTLLTTGGNDEVGSASNPVIVWDARTGQKRLTISRHTGQVWWGDWSPDGKRIATGSTDGTTRVWDVETGAELLTVDTPNTWSANPRWSPDGQHLAVALFSFGRPSRSGIWRVWQTTEELVAYARECCVFRELTPEEREHFGLGAGQ